MTLNEISQKRKERLNELKKIKRSSDLNSDISKDTLCIKDSVEINDKNLSLSSLPLSFRNYDPEIRAPRIGSSNLVLKGYETNMTFDYNEFDISGLKPNKLNYDLKRQMQIKIERLKRKTEIAITHLTYIVSKSLIQIYHSSIPLLNSYPTYLPLPSDLLSYISTTIISVHSLSHELANQNAKNRAITTPIENNSFEGIIIPLDSNDESRVFISTKHRHKSGKYIYENSVLTIKTNTIISINDIEDFKKTNYIIKKEIENINANFTLTLTNKQKKQKENVILPHFKSQTINYPESSIYYSPDPEDDLDEEDPDNDLLL
ncbi:hypothetical protein PCANB_000867 [Pneumocystis canis]|nr:hypothetical protein PCANB_000867 [Pneumocystis canis]